MTAPTEQDAAAPLVSVIVPVYRAERWIEGTLRSALAQTHASLEVVVVDDGSPDRCAELVAGVAATDSRVRLIQQENAGLSAARNAGIAAARGRYVAPLDADDLWHPSKLEEQVEKFAAASREGIDLGLVYTWSEAVDEHGQPTTLPMSRSRAEGHVFDALSRSNFISCGSSAMLPRELALELGGFPVEMKSGCEDWALHLKIASRHPVGVVPAVRVGYRQLDSAMSRDLSFMLRGQDDLARHLREHHCPLDPRAAREQRLQLLAFTLLRAGRGPAAKLAALLRVLRIDPWFCLRPFVWRRALRSRAARGVS